MSEAKRFFLRRGMKVRLLVSPAAPPWKAGARDLLSKAWHMPVLILDQERDLRIRLALDARWGGAKKERRVRGEEDWFNSSYAPTTSAFRFMLGTLVVRDVLNSERVRRLLNCAAGALEREGLLEGLLPEEAWDSGEEDIRIAGEALLVGDLPLVLSRSARKISGSRTARKKGGSESEASDKSREGTDINRYFKGVREHLLLDEMRLFPEGVTGVREWLRERLRCGGSAGEEPPGLICGEEIDKFTGFAELEEAGTRKKLVYSDVESVLGEVLGELATGEGCGAEGAGSLARAVQRLVGGAEFVQMPFLWWPVYRTKNNVPLIHIRFLREVTSGEVAEKSGGAISYEGEYNEMLSWLSVVVLYAIKRIGEVEEEAYVPGRGRRRVRPYAGLAALFSEAFLAYRFWSASTWEQGKEELEKGAELLNRVLEGEARFILRARDSAYGGGTLARTVLYLAREPLPSWYIGFKGFNEKGQRSWADSFSKEAWGRLGEVEELLASTDLLRKGGA